MCIEQQQYKNKTSKYCGYFSLIMFIFPNFKTSSVAEWLESLLCVWEARVDARPSQAKYFKLLVEAPLSSFQAFYI